MSEGPQRSCEWTNCPTRVGSVCCKDKARPGFDEWHGGRYAGLQLMIAQAAWDAATMSEREHCARLCESTYPEWSAKDGPCERPCFDTPPECAAAIRARP